MMRRGTGGHGFKSIEKQRLEMDFMNQMKSLQVSLKITFYVRRSVPLSVHLCCLCVVHLGRVLLVIGDGEGMGEILGLRRWAFWDLLFNT